MGGKGTRQWLGGEPDSGREGGRDSGTHKR